MLENADGIHAKTGPAYQRWSYAMVRSVLGNRVTFALKQAGVFDPEILDAAKTTTQNGA